MESPETVPPFIQKRRFIQKNGGEIDRRFGAPDVFLLPPGNPQERHFSQIQENLKNVCKNQL